MDRARSDDHEQTVVFALHDALGHTTGILDEDGFLFTERELIHQQGRGDDGADALDTQIVSGMGLAHGFRGEKWARSLASAAEKAKCELPGISASIAGKLPPLVAGMVPEPIEREPMKALVGTGGRAVPSEG